MNTSSRVVMAQNKVLEGQIKVAVRVRPLIPRERSINAQCYWKCSENTIRQQDPETKAFSAPFVFDHVFGMNITTQDIYDTIGDPIIRDFMKGFNGTIFAYGQTSSGKTYTMNGDDTYPGFIPLAVQQIFDIIEESPDREFVLRVSFLEIYREQVLDLLQGQCAVLKLAENENNEVIVKNLSETNVSNASQILELMRRGEKNRTYGETNMNERSSRSHTIFRIIVESKAASEGDDGAVTVSQLNLVDLAGSEKASQTGAQGDRFKEGVNINKSLSSLSLVIKQLSEGSSFVNYRDCKLTRILQNSLGGNSLTAIICAVTPAGVSETLSTLHFAGQAKRVKNKALVNEVMNDQVQLKRQKKEITLLQKQLEKLKETANLREVEKAREENDELRAKLKKLQELVVCSSHSPTRPVVVKPPRAARRHTMAIPAAVHRETIQAAELSVLGLGLAEPAYMKRLSRVSERTEEDDDSDRRSRSSRMTGISEEDDEEEEADEQNPEDTVAGDPISPPLVRRVEQLRAKSTGKKGQKGDSTPLHHTPRLELREKNTKLANENRRLKLGMDVVQDRLKLLEVERKNEEELVAEADELEQKVAQLQAEKDNASKETKKKIYQLLREAGIIPKLDPLTEDNETNENRPLSTPNTNTKTQQPSKSGKLKKILDFLRDSVNEADVSILHADEQHSELDLHMMMTPQAIRSIKMQEKIHDSLGDKMTAVLEERTELIGMVDYLKTAYDDQTAKNEVITDQMKKLEASNAELANKILAFEENMLFQEELIVKLENDKKSMRASFEEALLKAETQNADKSKEDLDEMKQKVEDLENQLKGKDELLKKASEESAALSAKLESEANSQVEQLKAELALTKKELENQERVQVSLIPERDAVEKEEHEKQTLQEELDQLKKNHASLSEDFDKQKTALTAKIASLQADVDQKITEEAAAEEKLTKFAQEKSEMEAKLSSLQHQLDEKLKDSSDAEKELTATLVRREEELGGLKSSLDERDKKIKQLEARKNELELELKASKADGEQKSSKIGQLEADLSISTHQMDQMAEEVHKLSLKAIENDKKAKQLQIEVQEKNAEVMELLNTSMMADDKVKAEQSLVEELKKKLAEVEEDLARKTPVVEELRKRLAEVTEDLQQKTEEMTSLNENLKNQLQEALDQLRQKEVQVSESSSNLENFKTNLAGEDQVKDSKITELIEKVIKLEGNLKEAENELAEKAKKVTEFEEALTNADKKHKEDEEQKRLLQEEIKKINQLLKEGEDAKRNLEVAEQLVTEKNTEISALAVKISDLEAELEEKTCLIATGREEVEKLKQELEELKAGAENDLTLSDVIQTGTPQTPIDFQNVELITTVNDNRVEASGIAIASILADDGANQTMDVTPREPTMNRTNAECVLGDTICEGPMSQDPLKLSVLMTPRTKPTPPSSVKFMTPCDHFTVNGSPMGDEISFFNVAESTRFDAMRTARKSVAALKAKGRRTEQFEVEKEDLEKQLARANVQMELALKEKKAAENAKEFAQAKCDAYLDEIQTLRVHLLAANDGGLAPVDQASICVQTTTIETPEKTPQKRTSVAHADMQTSPFDSGNRSSVAVSRRKSCMAALNETIGALNRTAAVVGLPCVSLLDDEDNVSMAEIILSLKNELICLQQRLEELPGVEEIEDLKRQLAIKRVEIAAIVRATLKVEVKPDEVSKLFEYECLKEHEHTEIVWRVQEDVTGTWFENHMADEKMAQQLAGLKAHMEEAFNVQRRKEFDVLTKILDEENTKLRAERNPASNEELEVLKAEKDRLVDELASKTAELLDHKKNLAKEREKLEMEVKEKMERFVPLLKQKYETEALEKVEQQWEGRWRDQASVYERKISDLQLQIVSSKDQLDSLHSMDQNALTDLHYDVTALQDQLEAVSRAKTDLEAKNANLSSEIRRLSESLSSVETLRQTLEDEYRSAAATCEKTEKKLALVEAKLKREQELVASLQLKVDSLEEAASGAAWREKESLEKLVALKKELEEEKGMNEVEKEKMRVHFEEKTAELEHLRKEVDERKAQLMAMSEKEEEERATILQSTLLAKSEEVSRLTNLVLKQKNEFQAERKVLEEKVAQWKKKTEELSLEKDLLEEKIVQLEKEMAAAIEKLSKEKATLEGQNGSLRTQIEKLDTEIADLKNELAEEKQANAQKMEEKEQLNEEKQFLEEEVVEKQAEITRLKDFIESTVSAKIELQTERESLELQCQQLDLKVEELKADLKTLSREKTAAIEDSRTKEAALKLEAAAKESLQNDRSKLEKEVERLKVELQQMTEERFSLQSTCTNWEKEVKEVNCELQKMAKEKESLENRCSNLEEERNELNREISALLDQKSVLIEETKKTEAFLETELAKAEDLKKAVLAFEKTEAALNEKLANKTKMLQVSETEILSLRRRIDKLKLMNEEKDKEAETHKAALKDARDKMNAMSSLYREKEAELRQASEEIAAIQSTVEAKQTQIEKLDKECEEYEQATLKADKFRRQYAIDLDALKKEHAKVKKELAEAVKNKLALEKKVEAQEEQLDTMDNDLEKATKENKHLSQKLQELQKNTPSDAKFAELEKSLNTYRAENRSLYKKIAKYQTEGVPQSPVPSESTLGSEVKLLREENDKLKKELVLKNRQFREMQAELDNTRAGKVRPSYNLRSRREDDT